MSTGYIVFLYCSEIKGCRIESHSNYERYLQRTGINLPPRNWGSSCIRLAIKEKGALNGQGQIKTIGNHQQAPLKKVYINTK